MRGSGYLYIGLTVLQIVYGQLVFKWRVDNQGALPSSAASAMEFVIRLFVDPWVVTAMLATLLASVTWALALTKFELSYAYPFTALSFVLVLMLSCWLLDEQFTPGKAVGVALIVAGVAVVNRG